MACATKLYKELKDVKGISTSDLKKIDWNYEKFLINGEGVPIRRYRPSVLPDVVGKDIVDTSTRGSFQSERKLS